MSEISTGNNGASTSFTTNKNRRSTAADTIFQRLDPREVEQFYKSYHFWLLQRRIETLYTEVSAIQQAIVDNNTLVQQIPLSAIALASLAQLQASGVSDLDLLDRMLDQGEAWLDHTMQLLEHCEKLDVIQGDYTQWCEHALEGAYDWIASMNATETIKPVEDDEQQTELHATTEEQLLLKLMSDEDATEKITDRDSLMSEDREKTLETLTRKITQPLDQVEPPTLTYPTRKITQPLDQIEQATQEAPSKKITQPLDIADALMETELTDLSENTQVEIKQVEAPTTSSDEIILQPETSLPQEEIDDDTAQIEAATLPIRETDTEKNLDNDTILDTSNQEIEQHSEQIDTPIHATETLEVDVQEQNMQDIAPGEVDGTFKDTDTQPILTASAQTSNEVVVVGENQKPQLQKVRRRGFWRLLNRLLAFILRR